jgi:hypothetical protein
MTTLGATDPFFDNAATTVSYPFHLIPEERYLEVFRTHLLTGHEYEAILRIDGSKHILRGGWHAAVITAAHQGCQYQGTGICTAHVRPECLIA